MDFDVIIVGGGPCGIAAAIEVQQAGLSHIVLERGTYSESIRMYPNGMHFFSTSDNLSIGNIPFATVGPKPSREEAMQYYRKVAQHYNLNVRLYHEVDEIESSEDGFTVKYHERQRSEGSTGKVGETQTLTSRYVIMATGYFQVPRRLGIPGEDLPHVAHYYNEPWPYLQQKVVIAGGGNSAVETALDLYHHGVEVTMIIRRDDFKPTAKYWLVPDLRNRIKEGKIKALFEHEITRITQKEVQVRNAAGEEQTLPADWVLLLVGYLPDLPLLRAAGVELYEETCQARINEETFETNIPGLYLAGTVMCGIHTESIFVENGRLHGKAIVEDIMRKEE